MPVASRPRPEQLADFYRGCLRRLARRSDRDHWTMHAAAAFYQAGVIRHRRLYLSEIIADLQASGAAGEPRHATLESGLLHDVDNAARQRVAWYYETTLALHAEFAEAQYNLARLRQASGQLPEALALFTQAAQSSPHPRARPHGHVRANAFWEAATIAEDRGDLAQAESLYRQALRLLDNFGPEHVRFPRLLQRLNKNEEALDHYERISTYAHRYAAEFIEPDYPPEELLPQDADGTALDPATPTRIGADDGASLFYFAHLYFRVPEAGESAVDFAALRQAVPRQPLLRLFGAGGRVSCGLSIAQVMSGRP